MRGGSSASIHACMHTHTHKETITKHAEIGTLRLSQEEKKHVFAN